MSESTVRTGDRVDVQLPYRNGAGEREYRSFLGVVRPVFSDRVRVRLDVNDGQGAVRIYVNRERVRPRGEADAR